MCGIFGFSRTTGLTRLMTPTLAIAMEQRGGDSWGVTDGDFIWKDNHSIVDSFVDCQLDGPTYHTRAASVGAVSERNAHPFHFEAVNIITGVHNGHLSNYMDLKRKYKRDDFEVDSEHIFAHLAEAKPVAELLGYGAVVWYEAKAFKPLERERFFSRWNTEALHFAQMRSGEIVFASTADSIKTAAILAGGEIDFFYTTQPNLRYYIKRDAEQIGKDQLWHDKILPWGTAAVSCSPPITTGRVNWSSNMDCQAAGCSGRIKIPDNLVCEGCYDKLAKSTYGG